MKKKKILYIINAEKMSVKLQKKKSEKRKKKVH